MFDAASSSPGANESAELSLSGFTPGNAYQLSFSATIVQSDYAAWRSPADALNVSLVGASIASWTSAVLTDAIADDNLNDWIPQSISFVATSSTVNFRFNDAPDSINPALIARFGIDGIQARAVPAPAAPLALLTGGALAGVRRRRR